MVYFGCKSDLWRLEWVVNWEPDHGSVINATPLVSMQTGGCECPSGRKGAAYVCNLDVLYKKIVPDREVKYASLIRAVVRPINSTFPIKQIASLWLCCASTRRSGCLGGKRKRKRKRKKKTHGNKLHVRIIPRRVPRRHTHNATVRSETDSAEKEVHERVAEKVGGRRFFHQREK